MWFNANNGKTQGKTAGVIIITVFFYAVAFYQIITVRGVILGWSQKVKHTMELTDRRKLRRFLSECTGVKNRSRMVNRTAPT